MYRLRGTPTAFFFFATATPSLHGMMTRQENVTLVMGWYNHLHPRGSHRFCHPGLAPATSPRIPKAQKGSHMADPMPASRVTRSIA